MKRTVASLKAWISESVAHPEFKPSYLIFPTPGCWEVNAQIDNIVDSKLTFITKVVKIGDAPSGRWDPE